MTFLAIGMGLLALLIVGLIVTAAGRLTIENLESDVDPLWQQDGDPP